MPYQVPADPIEHGEYVKAGLVNQTLRTDMSYAVHQIAFKDSGTARTSTTTPTNDPHLVMTLGASELWWLDFHLRYSAGAGSIDLKLQFSGPSDCRIRMAAVVLLPGGINPNWYDLDVDNGVTSAATVYATTTAQAHRWTGYVYSTSVGTFALQWSQNTLSGTALTMLAGSSLRGALIGTNPYPTT